MQNDEDPEQIAQYAWETAGAALITWSISVVVQAFLAKFTLSEIRRAAAATTQAAETSIRTERLLEQMRADAIADATEAAAREAVMLRWTIAGVIFAALAFIAAVTAIVLGLT